MATWADDSETTTTSSLIVEGDAEQIIKQLDEQASSSSSPADPDDEIEIGDAKLHGAVEVVDAETGVVKENTTFQSNSTFAQIGLTEKLLLGVKEMGWETPSSIQATALPFILKGSNVIAQAHHGSGKTGTFLLGILSRIDVQLHQPQAILILHTRELAQQCLSVTYKLARALGAAVYCAVGGSLDHSTVPLTQQIILGTPGRIRSLIFDSKRIDPDGIKLVVFDEADVLLDQQDSNSTSGPAPRGGRGGRGGKFPQKTRDSLAQQAMDIQRKCKHAQTLLFSATFSEPVFEFAKVVCPQAALIRVKKEDVKLDTITQLHIDCGTTQDSKVDAVEDILDAGLNLKQTIIFCNTIAGVKLLANTLRSDGFPVSLLHSKLDQKARELAIEDFRTNKTKVLVSTNVIARGLDVPTVSLVINFDIPMQKDGITADAENYMHRIARGGRFGTKACSIALTFDDASRKALQAIVTEFELSIKKFQHDNQKDFIDAISKSF